MKLEISNQGLALNLAYCDEDLWNKMQCNSQRLCGIEVCTQRIHAPVSQSEHEGFPCMSRQYINKYLFVLPSGTNHMAVCFTVYVSAISSHYSPLRTCSTNHHTTAGAVKALFMILLWPCKEFPTLVTLFCSRQNLIAFT